MGWGGSYGKFPRYGYPVLPNGPIFSDFGPESDFFEQNGLELVRITPQKSGLGGNK